MHLQPVVRKTPTQVNYNNQRMINLTPGSWVVYIMEHTNMQNLKNWSRYEKNSNSFTKKQATTNLKYIAKANVESLNYTMDISSPNNR